MGKIFEFNEIVNVIFVVRYAISFGTHAQFNFVRHID